MEITPSPPERHLKARVKSLHENQVAHQDVAYLYFLKDEAIAGLPLALNLLVPIYKPEWREALCINGLTQDYNTDNVSAV